MIPILLPLILAAAPPDQNVTLSSIMTVLGWVTGFVAMVLTAVFKSQAKAAEAKAEAAEDKVKSMRLEDPVPTVPVQKVGGPAHFYQYEALERRVGVVEASLKEVIQQKAAEYVSILEAGQERELRLMEKMDGQTRELHARLDDQFGPRPKKAGGGR